MLVPHLSEAAYEAIRIFSKDPSVPTYHNALPEVRTGYFNGITFLMQYPNSTPGDLHNHWLHGKLENGWSYAKEKDEVAKKHPQFMNYEKLSNDEQKKAGIFIAVFTALKDVDAVSVDEARLKKIIVSVKVWKAPKPKKVKVAKIKVAKIKTIVKKVVKAIKKKKKK